jgi:hypothetical protein
VHDAERWPAAGATRQSNPGAAAASASDDDRRTIDPVALASLVCSIPSTALAVADLAYRIGKRRRAKELIDHASDLVGQHVTARVITRTREVELRTMTPDQLPDLLDADETAELTANTSPGVRCGRTGG